MNAALRSPSETAVPEPDRATVLVVADDPHVIVSVRRALVKGYRVVHFVNFLPALHALRREVPAAVVADDEVRGHSTEEFLGAVREAAPDVARVMLSPAGHLSDGLRLLGGKVAQCIVAKPLDPAQLRGAVESLLAASSAIARLSGNASRLIAVNARLQGMMDRMRRRRAGASGTGSPESGSEAAAGRP